MDDYIDGVRQSYHGEVVAEGFYRRLARAQPEGYRRTALRLIADDWRARPNGGWRRSLRRSASR